MQILKIMKFFKYRTIFNSAIYNIQFNNENVNKTVVWLSGSLGQKKYYIPNEINIKKNSLFISFLTCKYFYFKYCVLYQILIRNDIYGLMRGFKSYLVVRGLGFKISLLNNVIVFRLGFSHNINYEIPNDIKITILPKKLKAIKIFSNDYQKVKEITSRIKSFKKPNSYKNQGIFTFKEKRKLKDSKKKSR